MAGLPGERASDRAESNCVCGGHRRQAAFRPPSLSRNQRVGRWGEQAAADYLAQRGYEILGHNIRTPYGEIDLLARREGIAVFVEVKSRTSRWLGPPEIAVNHAKLSHMIACAQHYAQQNAIEHWQIDVIAVLKVEGETHVTHFENAAT